MSRHLVGWLGFSLLLACAPHSAAQRQPSTELARTFVISGSVRLNDTLQAADMIKVDLKKFTGETVSTAYTRSNGEFEFTGLTRGSYYLVLEENEYEHIREQVEIFNADRRGITLYLRKPLTFTETSPGGSVVSKRELSMPKKARDAFLKGQGLLVEKQDSKGSIALFQRAIAEVPDYYEAYHLMGVAYAQNGQPAEAESAYQRAIDLSDGQFAGPYVSLAGLLCDLKRFADAAKFARKGLEVDANEWQAHYHLGRALYGLNQLADAEKSFGEVVLRRPAYPDVHLLFANIHMRKKDYPALLKDLDRYLELAPNGPASPSVREMKASVEKHMSQAKTAPAKEGVRP